MMRSTRLLAAIPPLLHTVLLICGNASAESPRIDLTTLSLEELIGIEVTLASRKDEPLFDISAPVFVLTREDLRRSGATSIPEALRLVPGLQVARIDANKWAVSARGFNDRFSQKLLVLVDGRNVYSPIFAGVFWEVQDFLLEDVARIEVIRGTGATLWGANAVNGIINIITDGARNTRGGRVKLGAGSDERGFTSLRYGGRISEEAHYRVYVRYLDHDRFVDDAGRPTADDWNMARGGFRADWQRSQTSALILQGDFFDGRTGQTFQIPGLVQEPFLDLVDDVTDLSGGHILVRWERASSAASDLQLQLYYDRNQRRDTVGHTERDTYDADFQHRFAWGGRQEIVWGLGYRFTRDDLRGSFKLSFDPQRRNTDLFSAFVQDDIDLIAKRLSLSLGSKFERNDFSGFEYQPSARLLWTPGVRHTLWAAVARAVRIPARADHDVRLSFRTFLTAEVLPRLGLDIEPDPPVSLVVIEGKSAFDSEKIRAFEVGYRVRPTSALFVDLAAFYNDYADLRSGRDEIPLRRDEPVPHFVFNLPITNLMHGTTRGFEVAAERQLPAEWGRLRAAYTYLKVDLDLDPGANPESDLVEMSNPEHQFYFWSSLNLHRDLQVDAIGRYVGALPERADEPLYIHRFPTRDIGAYFALDLRLGWQIFPHLELSLVGRNLLDDRHPELSDFFIDSMPTQTQRSAYGTLAWEF